MVDKKVTYTAKASFRELINESKKARAEMRKLRAEEEALNASSARNSRVSETASRRASKASQEEINAQTKVAKARSAAQKSADALANSVDRLSRSGWGLPKLTNDNTRETNRYSTALNVLQIAAGKTADKLRQVAGALSGVGGGGGGHRKDGSALSGFSDGLKKVFDGTAKLLPKLAILSGALALGGMINPLIAALGALGTAALGLASSLGSLIQVAAAVPGALAGIATAVGGTITAFVGVGDAFKALSKEQDAQADSATRSALDQAQAANQIVNARYALQDAILAEARARVDAAERVSDAERNLIASQRAVKDAQENLNDAREAAKDRIEELKRAVEGAAQSEDSATARLIAAQQRYAESLEDPNASSADQLLALSDIGEAEQALEDVKRQNKENAEELKKAQKDGVKGSEEVKDAQWALKDAMEAVRDAQREVNRARQDEPIAIRNANQAVKNANLALKQAQADAKDGGTAAATAAREARQALAKLSPAARKVVERLYDMRDGWTAVRKAVQQRFFSNIVDDLGKMEGFLPTLRILLGESADAMGRLASKGIDMVTSGPWKRDFRTIARRNATLIDTMGDAVLDLAEGFKDLIIAAGPFTQGLAEDLRDGARNFREFMDEGRRSGSIAAQLSKVRDRLKQWWDILGNIAGTIVNVAQAMTDFNGDVVDGLQDVTQGWQDVTQAQEEAGSPFKVYLERVKPLITEINRFFGALARGFAGIASDPKHIQHAIDLLTKLRTDLGPALVRLLDALAESDLPDALIEGLTAIVDMFTDLQKSGAGELFVGVLEGIGGTAKALGIAATAIGQIVDGLLDLVGIEDGLGKVAKTIGAIAGAVGTIGLARRIGGKAVGGVVGLFGGARGGKAGKHKAPTRSSGIRSKLPFKKAGLAGGVGSIAGMIASQSDLADKTQTSNTLLGASVGLIAGPWGAAIGGAIGLIRDMATANNESADSIKAANDVISDQASTYEEISTSVKKAEDDFKKFKESVDVDPTAGSNFNPLPKWVQGGGLKPGAIKNTVEGWFGKSDVEEQQEALDALKKRAGAAAKARFQQERMTKSVEAAAEIEAAQEESIRNTIDAMRAKRSATIRGIDAEVNWLQAVQDARHEVDRNKDGIKGNTIEAAKNRQEMARLAEAWNDQTDKAKNAKGSYKNARDELARLAKKFGVGRDEADKFIDKILEIPPKRVTAMRIAELEKAKKAIDEYKAYLEKAIPLSVTTEFGVSASQIGKNEDMLGRGDPRRAARALGGPIPGYGNTDSVHALLTPGEFVLNRRATAKIGMSRLSRWNAEGRSAHNPVRRNRGGGIDGLGGGSITLHTTINNPIPERASTSQKRALKDAAVESGWMR